MFNFPTNRFKKKILFEKFGRRPREKSCSILGTFSIYIYISHESSGKKFFWKNFNFDEGRKKKNFKEASMKEK